MKSVYLIEELNKNKSGVQIRNSQERSFKDKNTEIKDDTSLPELITNLYVMNMNAMNSMYLKFSIILQKAKNLI